MKIKIKKAKAVKKTFFDTKAKIIGFSTGAAVLVILLIVLMIVESREKSQLTVHNNTDMNLEYVKTKFVFPEGDLSDYITTEKIAANNSYTMAAKPVDVSGYSANYNIAFKFENYDEFNVDAGVFNEYFKGAIKISFSKTDDPDILKMTVKADNGLIPSKLVSCDEEFQVYLSNGKVIE